MSDQLTQVQIDAGIARDAIDRLNAENLELQHKLARLQQEKISQYAHLSGLIQQLRAARDKAYAECEFQRRGHTAAQERLSAQGQALADAEAEVERLRATNEKLVSDSYAEIARRSIAADTEELK